MRLSLIDSSVGALLAILLVLESCKAQDVIVDDTETWNAFFRDMTTTPPYPSPGTLNFYDWDQYRYGFQPGMWDTKDFSSLIDIEPEYLGQSAGGPPILWEGFWALFEAYLIHETGTNNYEKMSRMRMWVLYIQLMKEIYCCPDAYINLGTTAFGCWDTSKVTLCCTNGVWLQTCDNFGLRIVKQWSGGSIQTMKFKFFKWICTVHLFAHGLVISSLGMMVTTANLMQSCPNGCANRPCAEIPNALQHSCIMFYTPRGVYRNEFQCECRDDYQFDVDSKQCQLVPLCSMNPCSANGTLQCRNLDQGFECICRPEFMGTTCSDPINPCMIRENTNQVSGNIACRTSDGNFCSEVSGENYFLCDCTQPFTREINTDKLRSIFPGMELPPDNCQGTDDICTYVVCNTTGHGRCMPSGDWRSFICVCDKDSDGYPIYEGEFCEVPISQWMDWTQWTACRPECGDSCFQARQRRCRHKDGQRYCKGSDEEIRACSTACRPCPNRSFIHVSGVFIKETAGSVLLTLVSLFLVQTVVIAIAQWAFSLDGLGL